LSGSGTINFKSTRGTWDDVEKGLDCEEISNRSYTFGRGNIYQATVHNRADICGGNHTSEPNVIVMDDNFYMPQLNRYRRILLYLPPDYYSSTKRYPVLYMQDRQSLFDASTSYFGEWEVDESLNNLFDDGDRGCIIVGVENGETHRINEYSPWVNNTHGGGEGGLYAEFIVETLKPYIDENYRTLSDRDNTGVIGSSLGGLISFYIGLKYQDIFSKIGIFSPSFWFSESYCTFAKETPKEYEMKMYFLAGGLESGVVQKCYDIIDSLLLTGYTNDEIFMKTLSNGEHSEWLWRQEFPEAYLWLYENNNQLNRYKLSEISIFPNPSESIVYVNSEEIIRNVLIYN